MDTCDPAQVWTTSHCQDQSSPELVVQNLTLADGNSSGQRFDGGGGGAIFARGGQLRIVNSVFTGNRCERDGPDIGGAAVRALSQYDNRPVYVVGSRFADNACSNGGALSSIGVSWTVLNSRFVGNRALGSGANPARAGTPGGGSGGAIYNDGDQMSLSIGGSLFTGNHANEGGGAIFFVSDDRTGTMAIRRSTLERNSNDGFQTAGLPGIFFLGARRPTIAQSVLR
jgi:predicted outer membrane repeat protein